MTEAKNKKKVKMNPFLYLFIATIVFTLVGFSLLYHVSLSFIPKWVVVKSDSGIQFMQNPQLLEIRYAELEDELAEAVIPEGGIVIPVNWGDMGRQMVEAGVIDSEKFYSLYEKRGGLTEDEKSLLEGTGNGSMVIDRENANTVLNLLWAFGLGNSNRILTDGPMTDDAYGGDAGNFASTGGWTLAKGNPMDHYSMHSFIELTEEQQEMVERVASGIYRPCCGNSTYFPDCNHGMAMLGLMELMASQGAMEEEMYDAALAVNSFWFPDTYLTVGKYFAKRGVQWSDVDAKEVLGASYSSGQGYAQIAQEVEPVKSGGGGSCGV